MILTGLVVYSIYLLFYNFRRDEASQFNIAFFVDFLKMEISLNFIIMVADFLVLDKFPKNHKRCQYLLKLCFYNNIYISVSVGNI